MTEHSAESPDLDLEKYRPYLILLARVNLGQQLQGKFDASDLVQQTLLEAHRKREQFRGQSEAELAAWLRQMLVYALADARREFKRGKRNIARERSLQIELDGSSLRLEGLAAQESSPSRRAVRHENMLRLAAALLLLPEDQRLAVERKHLQGLTVAEIAALLNRSETAVGGLLRRGMTRLRELLIEKDESHDG
jgi:RNA polymerase sigma-70 factor (ECF subfamily)